MNDNSNRKDYELLLNLLDKAEEILSIINLSDSSISKYNTLKKMIFEKLNLEFKPLEKKFITSLNQENNNNNNKSQSNNNNNNEILYTLYFLNIKKSMIIDLFIDFLVNNNSIDQEKDLNYFLTSLTEIYNLPVDKVNSKNVDTITSEAKMENSKLAALFTRIDQTFMSSFEILKKMKIDCENELTKIRDNYNRDLSELKISSEKNSNLECELFKIRKENEKNYYYLDKMSLLINESYEKYKRIFPNDNNDINLSAYYNGKFDEDILKLEFIKNRLDEIFENNNNNDRLLRNYNNNNIDNLKRNNIQFENDYKYINNKNINNDELIKDINNYLPEIQKESDIFHKNFSDLMNYIETNIEGKII